MARPTKEYDEPTQVIYMRIPRSVYFALQRRAQKERRSLSDTAVIALEGWLRQAGELPREREPEREAEGARA